MSWKKYGGLGNLENMNNLSVHSMVADDITVNNMINTYNFHFSGADISYNLTVGNNVQIYGSQGSSNTTTGALVVYGGVGIGQDVNAGGNLYVGGNTNLVGTVDPIKLVDGSVLLTNTPCLDYWNNFGVSWKRADNSINTYWQSIAMSATGQYQSAVVLGGTIYRRIMPV
jgi:hypothetical protein